MTLMFHRVVCNICKLCSDFNNDFTANLQRNHPVKFFENRLRFDRIMAGVCGLTFWHTWYVCMSVRSNTRKLFFKVCY